MPIPVYCEQAMSNQCIVRIDGMHCPSCVVVVERALKALPGVVGVRADLRSATVRLEFQGDTPPDKRAVDRLIEPLGYHAVLDVNEQPIATNRRSLARRALEWVVPAAVAAVLIGLFTALQHAPLFGRIASQHVSGAVTALIVGVAASVSSCLALVGSFVIGLNAVWIAPGRSTAIQRNGLFHIGRLGAFALLGGTLGTLGGSLTIPVHLMSALTMLLALVVLGLGFHIMGLWPNAIRLRVPQRVVAHMDRLKQSRGPAAPIFLGALTVLLPCGFTLSMQAVALGAGSFVGGAAVLGAFAVGTVPVLFAAGMAGTLTTRSSTPVVRAAGLLVVAFAANALFAGGGNLYAAMNAPNLAVVSNEFAVQPVPPVFSTVAGAQTLPVPSSADAARTMPSEGEVILIGGSGERQGAAGEVQHVETRVMALAFEPNEHRVKAGIPVEWSIVGVQVSGCTNRIVVNGTDISVPISNGVTEVVRFVPTEPGVIHYSCWMYMVAGKFIVE